MTEVWTQIKGDMNDQIFTMFNWEEENWNKDKDVLDQKVSLQYPKVLHQQAVFQKMGQKEQLISLVTRIEKKAKYSRLDAGLSKQEPMVSLLRWN